MKSGGRGAREAEMSNRPQVGEDSTRYHPLIYVRRTGSWKRRTGAGTDRNTLTSSDYYAPNSKARHPVQYWRN